MHGVKYKEQAPPPPRMQSISFRYCHNSYSQPSFLRPSHSLVVEIGKERLGCTLIDRLIRTVQAVLLASTLSLAAPHVQTRGIGIA